jgi:hypothetical protein
MIVREYIVQLQTYHDEIIGRLMFTRNDGTIEESALYSLSELNNIVALWQSDGLLGSFAIGTQLHVNAPSH